MSNINWSWKKHKPAPVRKPTKGKNNKSNKSNTKARDNNADIKIPRGWQPF